MVRDHVLINDYSRIKEIISALEHDFTLSSSPNSRKGGLVGIAATAIALGRVSDGMPNLRTVPLVQHIPDSNAFVSHWIFNLVNVCTFCRVYRIDLALSGYETEHCLGTRLSTQENTFCKFYKLLICFFSSQASIGMHLPELVQPVLACFEDQDARVRYYACESLYNISKVARGAVLVFFNNMFEGLCKV